MAMRLTLRKGGSVETGRLWCRYVVASAVDMLFVMYGVSGGGKAMERIYYSPEFRVCVEDHQVVGTVMLDSAERWCV